MIVDPHTHTAFSSPCSRMDPEELVSAALSLGLGAVAVTEHSRIGGADVTCALAEPRGLICFRGVEVYTPEGDMLVYGVYEDIDPWESARALIEWVHAKGGIVVAAHPFRGRFGFGGRLSGETPEDILAACDGIETHNGADSPEARESALAAAQRLCLPGLGGSDAHIAEDVGRCVTLFSRPVSTEGDLVAEIKAGRVRGATLDEAMGTTKGW